MNFRRKTLLPAIAVLALAAASTLTVSVAQETASTSGVPTVVDRSAAGELAFWNTIKDSSSPDDFKAYIVNFPNGMFQDPALQRFEAAGGNRSDLTNVATAQVAEAAAEPEKPKSEVSRSVAKAKPAAKAKSATKAKSKKARAAKAVSSKKKSKKSSVRKSASKKTCKSSSNNCAVVTKTKAKKKPATNPSGIGAGGGGGGGGGNSGGGGGWGG